MEPKIAQKAPYVVELELGREYRWCACGKSNNQPFCDGSHHGSGEFKSLVFSPKATGNAYLCGCKHSKNAPYCDGTHRTL